MTGVRPEQQRWEDYEDDTRRAKFLAEVAGDGESYRKWDHLNKIARVALRVFAPTTVVSASGAVIGWIVTHY